MTSNQRPKDLVNAWVDAFNKADADLLASLYSENATNHQITQAPVIGRDAIRDMFEREFSEAQMYCIIEQVLGEGDWATLEWKDPNGLRGCGFFQVQNNQIIYQRGYWDKLSFLRLHKLPIPQH